MPRARQLKPHLLTRESYLRISPLAKRTFDVMITHFDDGGVHPDSALALKLAVWGVDEVTAQQVEGHIAEMVANGLVIRFQAAGGSFLHVVGWWEDHRESKPFYSYPLAPGWIEYRRGGRPFRQPATVPLPEGMTVVARGPEPIAHRSGTVLQQVPDQSETGSGLVTDQSSTDPGQVTDQSGTSPGNLKLKLNLKENTLSRPNSDAGPAPDDLRSPSANGQDGQIDQLDNGQPPDRCPPSADPPAGQPDPPAVHSPTKAERAPRDSLPAEGRGSFAAFWASCPKKVKKSRTSLVIERKATELKADSSRKLATRADAVAWMTDRMLAYARSPAVTQQEKQFIPDPSTWLNDGRFDDDDSVWNQVRNGNSRNGRIPQSRDPNVTAPTSAGATARRHQPSP